jgi:hypothetical protein
MSGNMTENRVPTLLAFVGMGLLVAVATIFVVHAGPLQLSAPAYSCPSLTGGSGPTYCENMTLPLGSGQGCTVGANDSGVFHGVSYSFHTFVACPEEGAGINGTVTEQGGSPLYVEFLNGAPPRIAWFNWTSPDGRVAVDSFGGEQELTLVVRE